MSRRKEVRLIDKYKQIQKIGTSVEVPWSVYCFFGASNKSLSIVGEDVYFGEDLQQIDQARKSTEWLVNQLGGKVKWEE